MDKFESLRRTLDDAVAGDEGPDQVIRRVLAEGRIVRRRRAIIAGSACAVVAVGIAVTLLAIPDKHQNSIAVTVTTSQPLNFMEPLMPTASPPGAVVTAQQTSQSALATALGAFGAQITGAFPDPPMSSAEYAVGGAVKSGGNQGVVRVTVYRETSGLNVNDPCGSLQDSAEWNPPRCDNKPQSDGSRTWTYELVSKLGDGEVVVDALNIRPNGQAVFVQADNASGSGSGGSHGYPVLTINQAEQLSELAGLAFPG